MSNLAKRVEKGRLLNFVDIPGSESAKGATRGSDGIPYHVSLFRKAEGKKVALANGVVIIAKVITTSCQALNVANGKLNPMEPCKGNSFHTVCYHSFGYIETKLAERGQTIEYCDSQSEAIMAGGGLTKIESKQGGGIIWASVKQHCVKQHSYRRTEDGLAKEPKNRLYRFGAETNLTLEEWRGAQEQNILDLETNRRLMHGEDDEGID
jgi:hypothetical protein